MNRQEKDVIGINALIIIPIVLLRFAVENKKPISKFIDWLFITIILNRLSKFHKDKIVQFKT